MAIWRARRASRSALETGFTVSPGRLDEVAQNQLFGQ